LETIRTRRTPVAPRAPKKADESTPKTTTTAKKTPAKTATTTRKRTVKMSPVIVTPEDIAFRAYMISLTPESGDQLANWLRAEEELSRIAA
jgi:hypothetical protein